MTAFDIQFSRSKGPTIKYEEKILHWSHKFPIKNGDKLKISIEKTNSNYIQGLTLDIQGSCEINGKLWQKRKGIKMVFWEDAKLLDPRNIELTIFCKRGLFKRDFIYIQNVWETEYSYLIGDNYGNPVEMKKKMMDSGHNGAAMIVEEIENGRRYYCNDCRPIGTFDSIVFTVQKN